MELPPQPSPSGIEVTCEDDPLTLEWEVPAVSLLRTLATWTLLLGLAALVALPAAAKVLAPGAWRGDMLYIIAAALLVLTLTSCLLVWNPAPVRGNARLVLHPDSMIWVPGDGSIPQVYRKTEVSAIDATPEVDPVTLALRVEPGSGPRVRVPLSGVFRPGDLPWLAEVLERWRTSA